MGYNNYLEFEDRLQSIVENLNESDFILGSIKLKRILYYHLLSLVKYDRRFSYLYRYRI